VASRRRRSRNRFLENLGGLPRSTMLTFGLALLLLVGSVGIVGTTLARRSSAADRAVITPTPEATAFVAIVETPPPAPPTGVASPSTRASATARAVATPSANPARTTPTTASTALLGSGQGKAARGIAGSMVVALGGTLPPVPVAAPVQPTIPTQAGPNVLAPTATERPTTVPVYSAPPATIAPSSGGGTSGGGTSGGGGGTTLPTATPFPPTSTPLPPIATAIPPTATPPPPTATPVPTPPPLPVAVLPGPGSRTYSYSLTYAQNANLAALPVSGNAFAVTWATYTSDDAAALKTALGLTGAVEKTGDGFRVVGPGTLLLNNTTGSISYTAASGATDPALVSAALPSTMITPVAPLPPDAPKPSPGPSPGPSTAPAPSATPGGPSATAVRPPATPQPSATAVRKLSDEAALAAAKGWLTKTSLLQANADAGRVTRPTPEQVIVTFHPQLPGSLTVGDPMIRVTLGVDGVVREVYQRWPTAATPRPTTLRDVNNAIAEVMAGGGYLEVDQTVPSDTPSGTVFKGTAEIKTVSIGWSTAQTAADGTNYLVPVYVFEGVATLTNPPTGQPNAVPFRLYVPAALRP